MKTITTDFKGLLIIETDIYCDNRGWFGETYNKKCFYENGIMIDFVQDNHSFSNQKGILRGFHFQINPKAQSKLVRCTKGSILDVVVDLRKGSDTYKQVFSIELNEENKLQLLIPKGFAHAFETLTDHTEVQYKVDEYYSKECERTLIYNDPYINVQWTSKKLILSHKDINAKLLKDLDVNFSIKVLVTGAKGQLGFDMVELLTKYGINTLGIDFDDCNIIDKDNLEKKILDFLPDVIIHCAAFTKVDDAEVQNEQCFLVNVIGTKNLVEISKKIDAKFVLISSDYVFDGNKHGFYSEEDKTNPINIYGKTKDEAEKIVIDNLNNYFIVRTSWLYGFHGNNFVKTVIELAKSKKEISVVDDQFGSPTYSHDLAENILEMIQTKKFGIYHVTNQGYCSWFEFAQYIFDFLNIKTKIIPISSDEYKTKAIRPKNSKLSKDKLKKHGFKELPEWKDSIRRFINKLSESHN